jgi:hypothetical protein
MIISHYILRMINVLVKVVKEISTHILCSITVFLKSCRLWDNVEKCAGTTEATNDVIIWHMHVTRWISKAIHAYVHSHAHALGHTYTHTHTHKYVIFIAFARQQWFANAPQCYVIRTLCIFLSTTFNVYLQKMHASELRAKIARNKNIALLRFLRLPCITQWLI